MSIWEAIVGLRATGLKKSSSSDEVLLYIETLKKNLPSWAATYSNMSASYLETIPKINRSLVTVRSRLDTLKYGGHATAANPFSGIGVGVPVPGPIARGPFVLQSNYESNKQDVNTLFDNINAAMLNGQRSRINTKVDKAIKRLGEIEGRVTGESYSNGGHVFCSTTEVADWLVVQQVPSGGVFWDLFSVLVSMKPKQQTRKKHNGRDLLVATDKLYHFGE
jgi:hypothetical protein